MSITDELRKYVQSWRETPNLMDDLDAGDIDGLLGDFIAIADRIDVEHEAACAEAYGNGVMSVPIALDESQWVKLPVDADGVPIRVGDKVTEHEDGHTFKVDGFMDWDGEWWVFMRDGIQAPASRCTHHHEPTVEDVLREFVDALDIDRCEDFNAAIAEYAAKLRLVDDGKER